LERGGFSPLTEYFSNYTNLWGEILKSKSLTLALSKGEGIGEKYRLQQLPPDCRAGVPQIVDF